MSAQALPPRSGWNRLRHVDCRHLGPFWLLLVLQFWFWHGQPLLNPRSLRNRLSDGGLRERRQVSLGTGMGLYLGREDTLRGPRAVSWGLKVSLACWPHAGRALSAPTPAGPGLERTPDSQGWQNHRAGRKEVKQIRCLKIGCGDASSGIHKVLTMCPGPWELRPKQASLGVVYS